MKDISFLKYFDVLKKSFLTVFSLSYKIPKPSHILHICQIEEGYLENNFQCYFTVTIFEIKMVPYIQTVQVCIIHVQSNAFCIFFQHFNR